MLPLKDLMIVENQHFLLNDGDEDVGAVALVDIESVHPWQSDEVDAACATYWAEGYLAWVIVIFVRLIHRFKSLPSENFIVLN
jgi:hypothetical protein